jgi:hypothetical protein
LSNGEENAKGIRMFPVKMGCVYGKPNLVRETTFEPRCFFPSPILLQTINSTNS